MNPMLAASVIWRDFAYDWYFLPILLFLATAGVAARYWRFFVQWLNGVRGKEWTLFPAVIDVVSVVVQTEQTRGGEHIIGYLATLDYFYRNPDLQVGEYCRMFDIEDKAKAWADSLKGRNVMVHVDPGDPSHSVLREDDLDAATPPAPPHA
jgi:hypothetical protein